MKPTVDVGDGVVLGSRAHPIIVQYSTHVSVSALRSRECACCV